MHLLPPTFRAIRPLVLALLAGVLLGLPRALPQLAPAQILGFAALFLLVRDCPRLRDGLRMGALAGLVAVISALALMRIHAVAAAVLILATTFNYALLGLILQWLAKRSPFGGLLAGAGAVLLAEWAFAHAVPIFGTAQYTISPWSDWPMLVQHEALLGAGGTLLLVAMAGAMVAGAMVREVRKCAVAGMVAMGILWPAMGVAAENGTARVASNTLAVAATAGDSRLTPSEFRRAYEPLIASAAKQGAALVVAPEIAIEDGDRPLVLATLGDLARKYQVTLVAGWLSLENNQESNLALVLGPDGNLLAECVKTHHIPFMENYDRRGDGQPTLAAAANTRIGVMICQDDNFTDLACASAARHAPILAVPTFDWPGVEIAHFLNSRHRALETGCGMVRGTCGGYAAITGPDGIILAKWNHLTQGPGVVVANLPVAMSAPYVRFGDWPVLTLATGAVIAGLAMGRKKKPAAESAPQG